MNEGYQQYPTNEADDIFKKMLSISTMNSQMVVHRQDNLIFYAFTKQFNNSNRYFGIGLLLNGQIIQDLKKLYSILEVSVTDLVISGVLINLVNGKVVPCNNDLNDSAEETKRITDKLKIGIDALEGTMCYMHPVSFSVSCDEIRKVRIDNPNINRFVTLSGFTIVMQPSVYKMSINSKNNNKIDIVETHTAPIIITKTTKANKTIIFWLTLAISIIVIFLVIIKCGIG